MQKQKLLIKKQRFGLNLSKQFQINRNWNLKQKQNNLCFTCCQGENLDLAITKDEVVVLIGEGVCAVKTLTKNHLYCEPPPQQPTPGPNGKKREGSDNLPEFTVSSPAFTVQPQ